jgi:hypothetical protein
VTYLDAPMTHPMGDLPITDSGSYFTRQCERHSIKQVPVGGRLGCIAQYSSERLEAHQEAPSMLR